VTSVERYAVAHLIEWIFLLHEAGIDFVECLNKTRRREQRAVIMHQRTVHFPAMARQLDIAAPDPPVVGLRYLVEGEEHDLWGPDHPEAGHLRHAALALLAAADHTRAGAKALAFVARSLDQLLEPARMEVFATEQWAAAIEAAVQTFVAVYEQEYLQSEQVIEPLHKVLVDTPDLDSAVRRHRELTAALVHAADIVLFVTTPEKYKTMQAAQ
jgi:hypothetical protein